MTATRIKPLKQAHSARPWISGLSLSRRTPNEIPVSSITEAFRFRLGLLQQAAKLGVCFPGADVFQCDASGWVTTLQVAGDTVISQLDHLSVPVP